MPPDLALLSTLIGSTELPLSRSNFHCPKGVRAIEVQLYIQRIGWLAGCFGFNGPLRQYFSLYRAVSQREGERGEKG